MGKLRSIVVLLLCSQAWGAIATVSHPAAVKHAVASTTCANAAGITGNTGAGAFYAIIVSLVQGGTVSSVADNGSGGSNTYVAGPIAQNAAGGHVEIWYVWQPTHSATTITATFSSQVNSCAAIEMSGVLGIGFEVIKNAATSVTVSASGYTNYANSVLLMGASNPLAAGAAWAATANGTLESSMPADTASPGLAVVSRAIAAVGTGGNTISATQSPTQVYASAAMELTSTALTGWTFLGHGWQVCSSSTSCTITNFQSRAGNVMFGWLFGSAGSSRPITSITNGGTWTACSACTSFDVSIGDMAGDYTLNSSAASSLVFNWTSSLTNSWVVVAEYSYTGSATIAFDVGASTSTQATSTTPAGQALTLTGSSEIVSQAIFDKAVNVNAMSTAQYVAPRDLNATTAFTNVGFAGAMNTSDGSAPTWGGSATAISEVAAMAIKATSTATRHRVTGIY